jgi:hypothetical protein
MPKFQWFRVSTLDEIPVFDESTINPTPRPPETTIRIMFFSKILDQITT